MQRSFTPQYRSHPSVFRLGILGVLAREGAHEDGEAEEGESSIVDHRNREISVQRQPLAYS